MGAERQTKSETMSVKQGGYYWREIAKNCDDPQKLSDTCRMLYQELQSHIDFAAQNDFDLHAPEWAILGGLAVSGRVVDLQSLIGKQVAIIEQWRNEEFRARRGLIPPRTWEAHEVAKAILGYDPDIAAGTRDEEL